jgi:hypothetical protein
MDHSLTIRSNIAHSRLTANFAGYLDTETLPQLRDFLSRATTDAKAGIVREFELNIAQLYLLSSSAISSLAEWVKQLSLRNPDARVLFRTDGGRSWQKRALAPIRRLSEATVSVE